ncbi:MAG: histidine phosphatase family protein [Candidatus Didemnitutus sp.]|nr:histidine phosphatase family protein [Candidatus Didemnitutus sp.]
MPSSLLRLLLAALAGLCLWSGAFAQVASAPDPASAEPATRTLYLVRHGFYDREPDVDERVGNALNDLGRIQAALTGDRLLGFPVKFTSVTSSEFARAWETGDIIASILGKECLRNANLNETTPAGVGVAPKSVDFSAKARLTAAWDFFAKPNTDGPTHELLVCHGNVIRWFVCRALGVDLTHWTQFEIANASITMIQIRPDGTVRVQLFNDVSHVPVAQQTWSGRGPSWPLPSQPKPN